MQAIELNSGHDEIDMLADSVWKSVLITRNTKPTRRLVLVVVVFGLKQSFKFLNGGREFDPIASYPMSESGEEQL